MSDSLDAIIDSNTAPAAPAGPQDYGQNNENLPESLKAALLSLVDRFEKDNMQARAEEVRRIQRQREFFKGNQNLYWSGSEKRWKTISSSSQVGLQAKPDTDDEAVRYDMVENIYRAHTLIAQAVLSQDAPHAIFFPQDPSQPEDVATAKAAKDIETFIADNNRIDMKQALIAWYWFHDGVCASYTCWDVNGAKYGFKSVPTTVQGMGNISPNALHCAQCGQDTELPDGDYSDPSAFDSAPQACPGCTTPMGPESFTPAMQGPVPVAGPPQQFPNGQEKIVFIGGLELQRPFFAHSLDECPWITWETEVHRSWVKAKYPAVAEQISATGEGSSDSAEVTARSARIALAATSFGRVLGEGWANLTTYKRTWLRPSAFTMVEDEGIRGQLQQLFSDGCMVARAGATYCESSNENLDKKWAIAHAFEGDGMIRDGIGTDIVDTQRRLNIEENIQTETFERGIPSRFIDDAVIDFDAYVDAGSLACLDFPATGRPGRPLSDGFYDTPPVVSSPQMGQHIEQMRGPVPEFLTGNSPILFGGDTGGNDTASGISIVRDSALGRLALFKRTQNEFYAQTMLNAIECFRENRTDDVVLSQLATGNSLDQKLIRLDELRGNLYARTEADQSYPTSVVQRRSLITSLLQNPNPKIQETLTSPENLEMLKTALGLHDMKIPGEDPRRQQMRENQVILEGQNPPVDALLDQHDYHMGALQEWVASDEGQAGMKNPMVAQAARQHMLDHINGKLFQQQAALGNTNQAAAAGLQAPAAPPPGQAPEQPQ